MAFTSQSVTVLLEEKRNNLKGELYIPNEPKLPLPLVLVVPEWWGKNEFSQQKAKNITDHFGYVSLVVDLYGDSKNVLTPQEASQLATPFYKNPKRGVAILEKFIEAVPKVAKEADVTIDFSRIAALGYCFGGTQVLNLARIGNLPWDKKLLGVISVHGQLESTLKAAKPITSKILVLHGEADELVSPQEVKNFKEEMKISKANLSFHTYPDAKHGFTNPKANEIGKKYNMPIAYSAKADQDSWDQIRLFLFSLLQQ